LRCSCCVGSDARRANSDCGCRCAPSVRATRRAADNSTSIGLGHKILPLRKLDGGLAGLWPGGWGWTTLSIYPHDTVLMLLKFLAYLGAFMLAAFSSIREKVEHFGSRAHLHWFLRGSLRHGSVSDWIAEYFWLLQEILYRGRNGHLCQPQSFCRSSRAYYAFAIAMAFYTFHKIDEPARVVPGRDTGEVTARFRPVFKSFSTSFWQGSCSSDSYFRGPAVEFWRA